MNGDFDFRETLLLVFWMLPLPLLATLLQSHRRLHRWAWVQGLSLLSLGALLIVSRVGPVTGVFEWFADRHQLWTILVYLILSQAQTEAIPPPDDATRQPQWIRRLLALVAPSIALFMALAPQQIDSWVLLLLLGLFTCVHEVLACLQPMSNWRRFVRGLAVTLFFASLFWQSLFLLLGLAIAISVAQDAMILLRRENRIRLQRTRDTLQQTALQELLTSTGANSNIDEDSISVDRIQPLLNYAVQGTGSIGGAVFLFQEQKTAWDTVSRTLQLIAAQGSLSKLTSQKGAALPAQTLLARVRTDILQALEVPSSHITDAFVLKSWGVQFALVVPIRARARTMGLLIVAGPEGDGSPFTASDRQLLEFLGQQAAFSLHYETVYHQLLEESRLSGEFEIAARIQRSLLPQQLPTVPNLSIALHVVPAREVGGDYVDVLSLPDDRLLAVIGDVSGKGLGPGMIMLIVRTILHALVDLRPDSASNWFVKSLEERLVPQLDNFTFMTFLALRWNNRDRSLTWTGAGHEHILWFSTLDNQIHRIRTGGLAIGLRRDQYILREERRITLSPGDVVVLYTDGVTDCRNPEGQSFGLDRLESSILKNREFDSETIQKAILADVDEFRQNVPPIDDRTLLILKCI